jgi:16S rRNA G527 N7-methylase RsmG
LENELYKIKANLKSVNMESKEKRFKFLNSLIFDAKQPLTEKAWDRLEKIENLKLLDFYLS